MTTDTTAAVSRAILEDRYDGAMHEDATGHGKLQRRLDAVLWDLISQVARRPVDSDWEDGIVDRAEHAVRTIILDEIERREAAR